MRLAPAIILLFLVPAFATFSAEEPIRRIAFGSCAYQDQPQPIWDSIVESSPDLFIFLGDNIYGDTEDMALLREKYQRLAAQPGLARLRTLCPVIGTWDDHDFGQNDAGAEYPMRRESQHEFLDFFQVADDDPRRHRDGVYHSWSFGPDGRRTQVILLDARFFRSPLKRGFTPGEPGEGVRGHYLPDPDPAATILGKTQWEWLAGELSKPADLRIIGTGVQFIAEEHGWEAWSNFPLERQRLLDLIRESGAGGVVFISGDRHLAEISRIPADCPSGVGYPLHDVTSSSLNRPSGNFTTTGARFTNEINSHRVGLTYFETNSGMIAIDWDLPDPVVRLQIRDEKGGVVNQLRLSLSQLNPDRGRD